MEDADHIAALLHIHEKASGHGGALNNIANRALNELRKIDAGMEAKSDPPEHSLPGEPPREPPPKGATPPSAETESVGTITIGGANG